MNRLHRELAPVTDEAWAAVEDEAARTLSLNLAGRRLVEIDGPRGFALSSVPTGRTVPADGGALVEGVEVTARTNRPLLELRVEFDLARAELEAVDRGARDPDLSPLVDAARRIALAEDRLVFEGGAGGVDGVASASPHAPLDLTDDYAGYPSLVAKAIATLRNSGVDGPFGLALGPRCYTGVVETTEHGGYPVLEHLRLITGGPLVWAPGVDGSVVISQRGGDFRLTIGEDLSVGYVRHDGRSVTLFIEETVTFANDTPEAAIALRHRAGT